MTRALSCSKQKSDALTRHQKSDALRASDYAKRHPAPSHYDEGAFLCDNITRKVIFCRGDSRIALSAEGGTDKLMREYNMQSQITSPKDVSQMSGQRRTTRLSSWDYSASGYYFVTICTKERTSLFGHIECSDQIDGMAKMALSEWGHLCTAAIETSNAECVQVDVDTFVVMPNHVHLLVFIHGGSGDGPTYRSALSLFVGRFKAAVTKEIRKKVPGKAVWQRGYYDHVVRGDSDYQRIWEYIQNNPIRWAQDVYHID